MGVGKSAVCKQLIKKLQPGVYLDGDWCWNMSPFSVTDETKAMVMDTSAPCWAGFWPAQSWTTWCLAG